MLIFLSFTACYAKYAEIVIVDNFKLSIQDNDLVYEQNGISKRLDLGFSGEVHFLQENDGTPQIVNTEWGTVVAVAQSDKATNSLDCDTVIKGVVIRDAKVYLSPKTQHIATCGYGSKDPKMLINFAYMLNRQIE